MTDQLPTLYAKQTAAEIRKLLKVRFPATKFSVTTGRGSGVSAVDIGWTDGPTNGYIEELVSPFTAGRFDGMTDSYDYDRAKMLIVNGVAYHPGCNYIFTRRELSDRFITRVIEAVAEQYEPAASPAPSVLDYRQGRAWNASPLVNGGTHHWSWQHLINRAASDRQALEA